MPPVNLQLGDKNLNRIEKVELKNSEGDTVELQIDSKANAQIETSYALTTEFNLISNQIIELILSTATGAAIVPLSFTVADGGVTEVKIEDGAVTTDKIADDSITNDKIQDGVIDLDKLHNSGASDNQVVTWSDADSAWVPVDFATLQSSDGAVDGITPGTGFQDEGTEITTSGTLNIDVGNDKGEIAQFDTGDGSLTFINDLVIDSNGGNDGKIQFNIDGDAAFEYTIEASGSGLSFKESGDEVFYVHSSGSLVIPNLSLGAGGSYQFPDDDGTANQLLVTDGNGEVSWTSFEDVATESLTINADLPLSYDDTTNTLSINDIESDKIKDDTIVNDDIAAAAAIAISKLAPFGAADFNKVLVTGVTGEIEASTITSTELGYLTGLTGNIKDTFLH